jgi:hypothetical protein
MRVALSLSYRGIDYYFHELEFELRGVNSSGRVLIDLLLSHGARSERFISMYFDGHSLDQNSYQIENFVDSTVENYCSNYFKKNSDLLEGSVLTKPQRFLFKKGKALSPNALCT